MLYCCSIIIVISFLISGKFGCGLCYHPGIKMQKGRGYTRSYTTHDRTYPLRTHEETMNLAARAELQGEPQRGIKGISILSELPDFDMVRCVDLDLFHALVNVAKRFANLWFDEKSAKFPFSIRTNLSEVDKRLLAISPTAEVSRAPRSLNERSDWRGHEWFYWVVIYSIPVLKNVLKSKYYNHWALLVHAIALLMQNSVAKSEIVYADRYLQEFVSGIDALYGAQNVTFSCHLLTHLKRSVDDFAQPWTHSAFIYESFNAEIKESVKSSNGSAQQICKALQLKVTLQKLEEDVHNYLSKSQSVYLQKISTRGKTLAAPHLVIGSASLLGKPKTMVLPVNFIQAICRAGGDCTNNTIAAIYDRCHLNGVIHHGNNYSRASKQNNTAVMLESGKIFLIESFVVISRNCYVLGHYHEEKKNQKLCDDVLPHIIILNDTPERTLRSVSLAEVSSKLLCFSVEISSTERLNVACINVLLMEMLS